MTTPAANAIIASIANPGAGYYKIVYTYWLSGTTETSLANVKLMYNGTNVVGTAPSISAAAPVTFTVESALLDSTNSLSVRAVALATTGAVYNALISCTRIG